MRNSNIVQTWSMSFSMTTWTIVESLGPNDIYSFSSFSLCMLREMTRQWTVDASSTKIWNISVSFDPHLATWCDLFEPSKWSDLPRIFFKWEVNTPSYRENFGFSLKIAQRGSTTFTKVPLSYMFVVWADLPGERDVTKRLPKNVRILGKPVST